ncbi:MAG TPA: PspA/IM30 family protein [Longimicrobiaceae bacterium]|nr:PspA/IM30 family protein [Longimicrobiaceae bacterium]
MILGKFWAAFRAQLNKIANLFWSADPIAQMTYEYDLAVEQLKEGRKGLEMYAAFVEKVTRQVTTGEAHMRSLEAKIKSYLKAGDRETASRFALELERAKKDLEENREQLGLHQEAYNNALLKIQHANRKLAEVRDKIQRYDADLKMSAAEAEVAKLAESFEMNVTTDFGELETVIQQKIDKNRGRARVAADLSSRGVDEIKAEQRMEEQMAEDALTKFEVELGLRTPESTPVAVAEKDLGPAIGQTEDVGEQA